LSPDLDRTTTNPEAPEAPHIPPELLAAGAIAAAAAAFALVPPPIAPAPPPVAAAEEEAACATCGLSLPATETECAFCVNTRAAKDTPTAQLLRHWLVFILAMLAVFGAGWLLTP
jgi:hypothetical protein